MFEQITGFAELVGAVGVILSLLYVGKQLKQTNTMSRATARQSMIAQNNDWAMAIAASPSLSESLSKVHYHGLVRDGATDQERIEVAYAFLGLTGQIHLAFEHQKEGVITSEELNDLFSASSELVKKLYLASLWPFLKNGYPPDFQRWFEQRYNLVASEERGAADC